jgi:hypothetical protein
MTEITAAAGVSAAPRTSAGEGVCSPNAAVTEPSSAQLARTQLIAMAQRIFPRDSVKPVTELLFNVMAYALLTP